MKADALALACAILVAGAAAAAAQDPPDNPSLDRMRRVLQKTPLRLTVAEPEATFKIEIHAIHPMHEIFDKPAWQLDPIGWQAPRSFYRRFGPAAELAGDRLPRSDGLCRPGTQASGSKMGAPR